MKIITDRAEMLARICHKHCLEQPCRGHRCAVATLKNVLHKHPALDYADRYKEERDELLEMVKKSVQRHIDKECNEVWVDGAREICKCGMMTKAQALLDKIEVKK